MSFELTCHLTFLSSSYFCYSKIKPNVWLFPFLSMCFKVHWINAWCCELMLCQDLLLALFLAIPSCYWLVKCKRTHHENVLIYQFYLLYLEMWSHNNHLFIWSCIVTSILICYMGSSLFLPLWLISSFPLVCSMKYLQYKHWHTTYTPQIQAIT